MRCRCSEPSYFGQPKVARSASRDQTLDSGGNGQRNKLLGGPVDVLEVTTGVDQLGESRLADREAGGDGADAPGLLLEVPDECAAGAFSGEVSAVLGEDGDPRTEKSAAHRWDQGDAVHQVEHLWRVGLAGAGLAAAQQGIAALDGTPGGEILRAADLRRVVDAATGKGRARILGLQPVDHGLDPVDVAGADVVLLAEPRRHVDMGDVVAGGRIDAVERLEEDPVAAETFGDVAEIGAVRAGEAVAQLAAVVAGVGMVEASLSFERRLAARCPVLGQSDGEQGVADGTPFAQ